MEGAIADWVLLFRQIYDNLKPGGSCEMQEYGGSIFSIDDPTLSKTPNLKEWVELVNKGLISFGKELDVAPKLKKLMEDAGFLDVTEKIVKVSATYGEGMRFFLALLTTASDTNWSMDQGQEDQRDGTIPA